MKYWVHISYIWYSVIWFFCSSGSFGHMVLYSVLWFSINSVLWIRSNGPARLNFQNPDSSKNWLKCLVLNHEIRQMPFKYRTQGSGFWFICSFLVLISSDWSERGRLCPAFECIMAKIPNIFQPDMHYSSCEYRTRQVFNPLYTFLPFHLNLTFSVERTPEDNESWKSWTKIPSGKSKVHSFSVRWNTNHDRIRSQASTNF